MRIVVAPDSFKGSLLADEVAEAVARGIKKADNLIEIVKIAMADGGEGTVRALTKAASGRIVNCRVRDPLFREIEAFYGVLGDNQTAVIEMSAASGITLLAEDEKNPLKATTYGSGELIKHALDLGCRHFIIGVGGSATNDGGAGMAQALGAKLLDRDGNEIDLGGGSLGQLYRIDLQQFDQRVGESTFIAACDVTNPLCGPNGASRVYGPQKGADEEMIRMLDENLAHYGSILENTFNLSIVDDPGSGAAGGFGAGLLAFLGAELRKGIDIVIEITNLEKQIQQADLVITGEGRIDGQTIFGKTPFGVAQLAKKYAVPVVAIAGEIGEGSETLYTHGFSSLFSIVDKPMALEDAVSNASVLIENLAERIVRLLNTAKL
ncbi:MAG: glycerate kinase [Firmicutes bacterium]|nr:glycerate kinase [Bacillota bacterium]